MRVLIRRIWHRRSVESLTAASRLHRFFVGSPRRCRGLRLRMTRAVVQRKAGSSTSRRFAPTPVGMTVRLCCVRILKIRQLEVEDPWNRLTAASRLHRSFVGSPRPGRGLRLRMTRAVVQRKAGSSTSRRFAPTSVGMTVRLCCVRILKIRQLEVEDPWNR